MSIREDRIEMRRIIQQRRREQTLHWIQETKDMRRKFFPFGSSMIALGLALLTFRIIIALFYTEIASGNIQKNSLIGPIEVSSKSLYNLSIEHRLSRKSNNWCTLSMLLLDEHKNYITGASKDLYYEPLYIDESAEYSIVIKEPGTYYFNISPKYSKKESKNNFKISLNKIHLGSNYLTILGIVFISIGALTIVFLFHDLTLTDYFPPMNSEYSKKTFKILLIGSAVILSGFIFSGMTYKGYAGSSSIYDAPSVMFDNDDTHYFGR
tara:strand:+ start:355 stop:1152 length:798 start_codon:yes stop_codon:yes gene_type:complete